MARAVAAVPDPARHDGETVKDYGVVHWPTVVVLDPEGRVVDIPQGIGLHAEDFLASKLPPLPAAARIARALDRDLALNTDDDATLGELMNFYDKIGRIRIRLEPERQGRGDRRKYPGPAGTRG